MTTPHILTDLPLDDIAESPFQPRQIYRELDELAVTIREQGILQPLLVRPRDPRHGGLCAHELIFGHRRARAAALAGLARVPCRVVAMTDAEVRAAQAVENLQRADVHPFEEAAAFRMMIDAGDATAEQLAARFGKSRSHVYARLALLKACPEIRKACLAGEVGAEVALLIARLRTDKLQEKALGYIKADYSSNLTDGGKKSYRSIRGLLNEKFALELKGAIFDVDDATLLHDAGTCTACPKRAGNAPEFADVAESEGHRKTYDSTWLQHTGPNVCTDPDCFAAKKAAQLKRQAAALTAKGKTVIDGNKARAAISAHGEVKGAYVALKDVKAELAKLQGRKTLAGKAIEVPATVTIQDPRTGKTVEAVKREDIKAVGVKLSESKAPQGNDNARWEREREKTELACKAETERRLQLLREVRAAVAGTARSVFDLRLVARTALESLDYDDLRLLHQLWEMPEGATLEERVDTMDADTATRLLMDCTLVDSVVVSYHGYIKTMPKPLAAAAAYYGVGAATPSPAAQAPKTAKAKPVKAKTKNEVKDDAGVAGEGESTADLLEGADA